MPRPLASLVAPLAALVLVACGGRSAGTPTPTPGADRDDPAVVKALDLVAERTEDLVGFEAPGGPEISFVNEADLDALLDELLDDPALAAELERDEAFYTLIGLFPPGTDLAALYEGFWSSGIAGLYRPELDRLYIRLIGQFSALEEATAAHEYAHFLQDQAYNLEALADAVALDRDAALALQALTEGDASFVEDAYVEQYFNSAQVFGMSFGGLAAAAQGEGTAPYVLTRQTTFVYLDGEAWVGHQLGEGYEREALYASPPRTTREVLDPFDYRPGEPAPEITLTFAANALPRDWVTGPHETAGQLVWSIWLEELGSRNTSEATDGWVADAAYVFRVEAEPVALVARVDWETAQDVDQFLDEAAIALDRDRRYDRVGCATCQDPTWEGPAGDLRLHRRDDRSIILIVAPTASEAAELLESAR